MAGLIAWPHREDAQRIHRQEAEAEHPGVRAVLHTRGDDGNPRQPVLTNELVSVESRSRWRRRRENFSAHPLPHCPNIPTSCSRGPSL